MLREHKDVAGSPTLLRVTGVSKTFGAVRALRNMHFELMCGEVHVLFGENGAGKSTLINVIAGVLQPDEGSVEFEGQPVQLGDVHEARRLGIAAMFQEFSLAPHLSVEENIFLGAEPRWGMVIDKPTLRLRAREVLERFGFQVDPKHQLLGLSRAQQQMVEMTKALLTEPRVLILDEPTSSLSERETEALFDLVGKLKAEGVGIIYITHRIGEIARIADRITVMRDGEFIATLDAEDASEEHLIELMTGRTFGALYPTIAHQPGDQVFAVSGLSTADGGVRSASLELRSGEIVGIAGLVGCGKSQIGRAAFGLIPIAQGEIRLFGMRVPKPSPNLMLERGLCYVTSDRRSEGLMLVRCARENISLGSLENPGISRFGWLNKRAERAHAQFLGERTKVRPLELDKEVTLYSGGNQQKIVIAKGLGRSTRVLIFDEPTVGIDVSARGEVYHSLKELCESGVGILLISSDLPEILNLCHRIYVVKDGTIVDHVSKVEISESRILAGFFGSTSGQAAA